MNSISRLDFNRPLTITPYVFIRGIDEPLDGAERIIINDYVKSFTMQLFNSYFGEMVCNRLQCLASDKDGDDLLSAWIEITPETTSKLANFFDDSKLISYLNVNRDVEIFATIAGWIEAGITSLWFDWYEKPNLNLTSIYTISYQVMPDSDDLVNQRAQRALLVACLSLVGAGEEFEASMTADFLTKAYNLLDNNDLVAIQMLPSNNLARAMLDRFFLLVSITDADQKIKNVEVVNQRIQQFINKEYAHA